MLLTHDKNAQRDMTVASKHHIAAGYKKELKF